MKEQEYLKAEEFNTIKEVICDSVKKHEDKVAFVIKNKNNEKINKTYNDLLEDINSFGTALYSIGMENKRIAVIGKNRYEWVVAHLSNLFGGIISIPLDKDLQFEELENSLIRSEADAIVFDSKLEEIISKIKEQNKTNIKEFISMDNIEGYTKFQDLLEKGKKLLEQEEKKFIEYKINENELSVLLFTSGTTSQSKAVMLTQKNIASNIYALQSVEDIKDTDTNIAFLPFHHIFGSTCLLLMLAIGVRTVFPDGLRYIKQNMKEYKVSVFVGVPILTEAIYKAILKEVDKQGKTKIVKIATKISNLLLKMHIDIRRKLFKDILEGLGGELRLIVSGGAPADPLSIKGFNEFGEETLQGYGLSETSPVICAENYKYRRTGSVGLPMRNDVIEIVNQDEKGIGEIRVKGPNVMLGYYKMKEKTEEVLKDGWFYTGDLGYFDKDGFLFVTGRNKNLIVLKNGKKIFPEEIETLVNRIDLISECMVFGMPNKDDKNDVMLSVKIVYDEEVIKQEYKDKTEEELNKIVWEKIKEVNNSFPRYKHIQKLIVSHTELIKTTTKKVKRYEEMKLIMGEQ